MLSESLRDPSRLAVLAATGLLDADPDAALERIARIAAGALGAPIALISLVGASRQFFCAQTGLPASIGARRETPLSHSFCQHVVASAAPFVVRDARADPRLEGNHAIPDIGIQAYLGMPLEVDGHVLGAACVIDYEPRAWTAEQEVVLADLAGAAQDVLALRVRRADELVVSALERSVLGSLPDTAVMQLDAELRVTLAEGQGFREAGWPPEALIGRRLVDVLPAEAYEALAARYRRSLRGESVSFDTAFGGRTWWVQGAPLRNGTGDPIGVSVVMRDATEARERERMLAERESQYRLLAEHSCDVISRHGPDGRYLYVSPAASAVYGRSCDEMVGQDPYAFIHPDDAPTVAANHRGLLTLERPATSAYRIVRADGCVAWVESTAVAIRDAAGEVTELQCTTRDVTDRLAAEEAQKSSEALTQRVIAALEEGLVIHGADGGVLACNPSAERILGMSSEQLVRQGRLDPTWRISDERGREIAREDLPASRALATLRPQVGIVLAVDRPDGTQFWMRANAVPLLDREGAIERVLVSLADITELRDAERAARHRADHDPLTGLANRALLHRTLDHGLDVARSTGDDLAVLFLDIDHFKVVNDSHGHGRGDELLLAVVGRLQQELRGSADTLARFGGDEFVVVAPAVGGPEGAERLAQRLLGIFRRPLTVAGSELVVTLSIGVAVAEGGCGETGALLRDADAAMYQAKAAGRGTTVMFSPELRQRAVARMSLEAELRQAIANGQLELDYQPIWRLPDRTLTGVEALVRWRHPTRGRVSPAEFIPVAEQSGLILEIGDWVLETACAQLASWRRQLGNRAPTVAVNISARQLGQVDFGAHIAKLLEAHGLPAGELALELTESMLMGGNDAAEHALAALRDLGVRLVLDDFGTGYSSLSQLKDLTLDVVKVDRSFVAGLAPGSPDHEIVAAIVAMAHALNIRVVAEGVETEQQLSALTSVGCDQAQGYLLGRPAAAEGLQALLA